MRLTRYEKQIGMKQYKTSLRYYFYYPLSIFKTIRRKLKNVFYYGFDTSETWNLDYSLAKWLYSRLIHFKANAQGYPSNGITYEEWLDVIQEIIDGIEFYLLAEDNFAIDTYEEASNRYKHSLELITKYIDNLWD